MELKERGVMLPSETNDEEVVQDLRDLFVEAALQIFFMIVEATIMHAQLEDWSREYAKVEDDDRTGDDDLKAIMETD